MNIESRTNPVELVDVSKKFQTDHHATHAVRGASLSIRQGELVLLLGPSGSGKTTLLTLMAGFLRPTAGNVFLFNRDICEYDTQELQELRARHLGFIFQNFHLIDSLTVLENIFLVQAFLHESHRGGEEQVSVLLERLGIAHLASKLPCTLSQGEKQKVAIARALSNSALLLLADEPTANLETAQGYEVIRLLHELTKKDGRSVVVASHDLRLVAFSDRVFTMTDGQVLEQRSNATLTAV